MLRKINRIIRKLIKRWIKSKTIPYLAVIVVVVFFFNIQNLQLYLSFGSRHTSMILLYFVLFYFECHKSEANTHKWRTTSARCSGSTDLHSQECLCELLHAFCKASCADVKLVCMFMRTLRLEVWLEWNAWRKFAPPTKLYSVRQEDECSLPFPFWLGYQEVPRRCSSWFRGSFHFLCHLLVPLDYLKEKLQSLLGLNWSCIKFSVEVEWLKIMLRSKNHGLSQACQSDRLWAPDFHILIVEGKLSRWLHPWLLLV